MLNFALPGFFVLKISPQETVFISRSKTVMAPPGVFREHRNPNRSNCLSRGVFDLILAIFDHCIEDCQQLPCAGGQGEFGGFSGGLQAASEGFHPGVVSLRNEGCQREGASEAGSATSDAAFATGDARIAGMGGQPCKAGEFASVHLARFRQARARN